VKDWQALTTSMLFVLNNFINKRLKVKSNERLSALSTLWFAPVWRLWVQQSVQTVFYKEYKKINVSSVKLSLCAKARRDA